MACLSHSVFIHTQDYDIAEVPRTWSIPKDACCLLQRLESALEDGVGRMVSCVLVYDSSGRRSDGDVDWERE